MSSRLRTPPCLWPPLLAVLLVPLASRGQSLPAHEVKPIVLILLDTSGSMEYDADQPGVETGDNDGSLTPPTCAGVGNSGKSRYIVATEVLTGTFGDYQCVLEDRSNNSVPPCPREDCPYPVPHVVPLGTQAADGLIDRNAYDFKFGVMTFDTKASPATNENGGYSYGPEQGVNYGARNATAPTGPMVTPSASDDPADVFARNQEVQASIRSAIPVGGTPIAPLLYDARYFFQSDPSILNDPFRTCRPKSVVLITDGRANLGEGSNPYQDSVREAQMLRDMGVSVYVIGFKLADGVSSLAEAIATNNGSLDLPYFRADNSVDLVKAFSQILGNLAVATQSRTRVVVTSETGNPLDVQYQFNAAHAKVPYPGGSGFVPGLRQGIIERSVYQCGVNEARPNEAGLALVQRISDLLNARQDTDRDLFTWIGGVRERFEAQNPNLTAAALGAPAPGQPVPDFSRDPLTGLCRSGFLSGSYDQKIAAWRQNLIDYVRAADASCRAGYKTGASDHGSPVIQGRLQDMDLMIPSFRLFRDQIATRDVVLYLPTHDGILHAFRVDRPNGAVEDPDWGRELWGFIPNHLLTSLQQLPDGKRTVLDGSPVLKDIILSRTRSTLDTESASAWRSILLVGDREGGRGLSALDVTDNRRDYWQVLWEVSATKGRCLAGFPTCNPGGPALFQNDFSLLGWSFGRPEMGVVQVCPGGASSCLQGNLEEVAVAVVPGGSGKDLAAGSGRVLYVIRLDTGEKMAEFRSGQANVDSSCAGTNQSIDSDLVGNVTCFSTFPGTYLSRCFVGDKAGRLWRLEIGSPGIPNWNLALFYDPYASISPLPALDDPRRAPAYEAPSVAIQPGTGRLVIVYGAGDMDHLDDTTQISFVASLQESIEQWPLTPVPDRTCSPWNDDVCRKVHAGRGMQVGPTVLWKKFLGYDASWNLEPGSLPGERLMGAPVIFGSGAYFTTFTPSLDNPCLAGIGRIYGAVFDRHDATCQDLVGLLPDPNDPFHYLVSSRLGETTNAGAIPFGLTVVTRPACIQGASIASSPPPSGGSVAPFGSFAAPAPTLVVQTGVSTEPPSEQPTQGTTTRMIHQVTRALRKAMESLSVSSWGILQD